MLANHLNDLMRGLLLLTITVSAFAANAQNGKRYFAKDSVEIFYTKEELAIKLPDNLKPIIDCPMRDAAISRGPDSTYYLTGTTGYPDWWNLTSDIKVWKSKDLKSWVPVVEKPRLRATVWNVDREGTEGQRKGTIRKGEFFRPVWAPEINYVKNNFWLTFCIPGWGNTILKSTTGRPEGPYINALANDVPLNTQIDASLFEDEDGKVYSVVGAGIVTPLKDDLSGASGPSKLAKPANAKHVGFEGAFLFKANGKYHMAAAEFVNGDYHCFVASADKIYGPYGIRYLAIPHGGHNTFFKDN